MKTRPKKGKREKGTEEYRGFWAVSCSTSIYFRRGLFYPITCNLFSSIYWIHTLCWTLWGSVSPHVASAGTRLHSLLRASCVETLTATRSAFWLWCALCPFHSCAIETLFRVLPGPFPLALSVLSPLTHRVRCSRQLPSPPLAYGYSFLLNKSPYLLILWLSGSQTHSGGRFSNNQSSSRAERWEMGGFDFEWGGGVLKRKCFIDAKKFKKIVFQHGPFQLIEDPGSCEPQLDLCPCHSCLLIPTPEQGCHSTSIKKAPCFWSDRRPGTKL